MNLDDRFFVQPSDYKIMDDTGKILTGEAAKAYSLKRKLDMEQKLKNRSIDQYLSIGMIIQVKGNENLYKIIDRFVYKDNIMYDYKVKEYDDIKNNFNFINHDQVTKAFIETKQKIL